jgi:hypothetical protein
MIFECDITFLNRIKNNIRQVIALADDGNPGKRNQGKHQKLSGELEKLSLVRPI